VKAQKNITDRALRYRAQKNVTGPLVCVICGRRGVLERGPDGLDVMHLDGHEEHEDRANLAYGCRRCNASLAAAFKSIGAGRPTKQYNPSKGVPTFQQYAWAVSNHSRGAMDEAGAIIHATPRHKRIEYAKRIAGVKRSRGTDSSLPDWARNPGRPGEAFKRCVRSVKERGSAGDPKAVCAAAGRKKYGKVAFQKMATAGRRRARRNPADESAAVFEEFHGYEPTEIVKVSQQVHHHSHLAAAGELVGLQVEPISGGEVREIEGMGDDCFLTFNEKKSQLFVSGGDQSLSAAELKKFGIRTEHELQTLGKLVGVGYFTDKTHLGKEGGEAVYSHQFRTTNENGRHIVVKITRYPDLIYRVLDQRFEISGGDYVIRAEGIDQ